MDSPLNSFQFIFCQTVIKHQLPPTKPQRSHIIKYIQIKAGKQQLEGWRSKQASVWFRLDRKITTSEEHSLKSAGQKEDCRLVSYLAWLDAKEGKVNSPLRASHHPQPHEPVPLQPSWTKSLNTTLDVRTCRSTVTEGMDDEPQLQKRRQRQPCGSRPGVPTSGWTLTKFSSSFCLIASVYEPSSLVCNSVNRSLSWN